MFNSVYGQHTLNLVLGFLFSVFYGGGKGETNKSEVFKLAAGEYEGKKRRGDCRAPFHAGKKSRSLKRDKVYRYLAKSIPN